MDLHCTWVIASTSKLLRPTELFTYFLIKKKVNCFGLTTLWSELFCLYSLEERKSCSKKRRKWRDQIITTTSTSDTSIYVKLNVTYFAVSFNTRPMNFKFNKHLLYILVGMYMYRYVAGLYIKKWTEQVPRTHMAQIGAPSYKSKPLKFLILTSYLINHTCMQTLDFNPVSTCISLYKQVYP